MRCRCLSMSSSTQADDAVRKLVGSTPPRPRTEEEEGESDLLGYGSGQNSSALLLLEPSLSEGPEREETGLLLPLLLSS